MERMTLAFIMIFVGIIVAVPLHIYFVIIPQAKEASSHGGMAPNYYHQWLKEQGCYETVLGIRCVP